MPNSLKEKIRTIPNWPKPGIMFRDVTTLFKDAVGFSHLINLLFDKYKDNKIDKVAGIEARGFIIGSALAHKLAVGFIPIRKKGKLPAETISEEYEKEYGPDIIEIHKDAINPDERILLIDDLVATGGTALAACKLIKKAGGDIVECGFVVDLPKLGGRKKIEDAGFKTSYLIEFEGE
ncbi:MAG: adenine phosphoribosyltransferase [Candidatus Magasanikbacteria bacterium]|nr:adenine phosphoribosyltransferase [Candidatus Magasanikbacteria bacterium]